MVITPASRLAMTPGNFTYNPRFPGQTYDAETGLYYNYHRTYDPGTGGYTQADPLGLGGGQFSLYSYVGGNPVNFIDPLGLTICWPWGSCTGEEHYPPTDRVPPGEPKDPTKPKRNPKCDDMPNFDVCMSCCTTISGQLGPTGTPGGPCAESCYRKQGITKGPANSNQCGG
jgi:RHS repeat-associated protein